MTANKIDTTQYKQALAVASRAQDDLNESYAKLQALQDRKAVIQAELEALTPIIESTSRNAFTGAALKSDEENLRAEALVKSEALNGLDDEINQINREIENKTQTVNNANQRAYRYPQGLAEQYLQALLDDLPAEAVEPLKKIAMLARITSQVGGDVGYMCQFSEKVLRKVVSKNDPRVSYLPEYRESAQLLNSLIMAE